MQIDRVFFPTETLGYGKRISIWTIGCPRRCFNCSNPELWEPDNSRDVDIHQLEKTIRGLFSMSDGITITGGDPFFQVGELLSFLQLLRKKYNKEVLVFTGYTMEQLMVEGSDSAKCLGLIDILIDGEYIDELNDNVGLRGSSNQRIIILNKKYKDRYAQAPCWPRQSQTVLSNGKLISIGIPVISNLP